MEYNFNEIEARWQQFWESNEVYKVEIQPGQPKCYVLDMFPYPSGAGLHVGHPLGYIASDIYSRYKRLKGFNVLHPMGFDSFGLPAEQYALETGQHPATTTEKNIKTFKEQLRKIGFCYDWSREVRTSDPSYYRWTQWIFLKLYNSYFCNTQQKARPIEELIVKYETRGAMPAQGEPIAGIHFTAEEWRNFSAEQKEEKLMRRRLVFSAEGEVNWCEALGTVLANDEVVNGFSERGGHPVVKKKMRQWYLRITAYAERLLQGLETVDFSESMKEMQRNWIGKSEGAEVEFEGASFEGKIKVYTTRPDTIFGVDFMVLAPEHGLVQTITTEEQQEAVHEYLEYVKTRSERERMAEVKQVTGCFTGAYVSHPFTGRKLPVWISEYVLAGYGTGAIMAVPCGDQRDFSFARHFNIPITNILGNHFTGEEANPDDQIPLENADFLNGYTKQEASRLAIEALEKINRGKRKINYKMRDAGFSRQRYWGEPFPIVWKNGTAYPMNENELPLVLPHVDQYSPGPEGQGPLANITDWVQVDEHTRRETSTMPGFAGSSWYFLRFMDPHNRETFCSTEASSYWNQVDVYIGGTEHAVGHLLYSRMWTKVLFDLGLISYDEPFKKLVNQGMIQGSSRFVYRIKNTNQFVSAGLKDEYETQPLHVDVNMVDGVELDTEAFRKWKPDYAHAEFILDNGKYICGTEVEKMSKSKFNTVNPDTLVEKYGADTFRMYEMFLGPIEQSKPWDTKGIEGVHRFLRKLWRLFMENGNPVWTTETPTRDELKVLHKTIRKIEQDTAQFSFNTAVSAFMVCVNELTELKCHKKDILDPMLVLLAPYAPHIAEELWHQTGNADTILRAGYPVFNAQFVQEDSKVYPVSVNGKLRTNIELSLTATQDEVQEAVMKDAVVQKWMEDKPLKKFIFIQGKMINVVV
ncbi:MAG TPA: leucine--tRNA ligase [Chitinophagaceae bacterium]|nr:leucine--tRNA ligase [Chitinophagaceae bacterium]HML57913.1 leucine--tRNA ligase [Ferruginibacter sp.]